MGTSTGNLKVSRIVPYFYPRRDRLYRAFFSGQANALAHMTEKYRFAIRAMRVAGLLLFWGSVILSFSLFTRLLHGVPLRGEFGKAPISAGTFMVIALQTLTTVVKSIAHVVPQPTGTTHLSHAGRRGLSGDADFVAPTRDANGSVRFTYN